MFYDIGMPAVVFFEYLVWQYGDGIREYANAWLNIHWFLWRVFSVPLLLRTFFAPFRRTGEHYKRGFDPAAIAQTFLINMITRFVGMVVRAVLVAVALLFQTFALVGGALLLVFFMTAPLVIPISVLTGIVVMIV
ncbi:MAG: hypothetical protein G01um101429_1034 [Parcubacteria group bacterium Gr01-1014_29]|nr:MAG: hypothetical protein G01um101429_1034 [Parcubacteria group bacterium Gr01-1014_29]